MNIDKKTEYVALRQEILDCITSRDNFIMAMYTITATILCVAFELENPILFLIPYIILFAFQNTISAKNENMIVIATYIAVCLEEGHGWESCNNQIKGIMHEGIPFKRPRSVWSRLVGRIGSVQLGLLCSISCSVFSIIDMLSAVEKCDTIEAGIYIALSLILYILIRIQTKDVLKLGKRRKAYIENLQRHEEQYKERELTYV